MIHIKKIVVLVCVALMLSATVVLCKDKTDDLPSFEDFVPVDTNPKLASLHELINLVKLPETTRDEGVVGVVTIGVLINKDGKPVKTRIIASNKPNLNDAVIDAVMQYASYIPATRDGKPLACWMIIPVDFTLPANNMVKFDYAKLGIEKAPAIQNWQNMIRLTRITDIPDETRGEIVIAVLINEQATSIKYQILSSTNELLNKAVIKAITLYRNYIPAEIDGEPTTAWLKITMNFKGKDALTGITQIAIKVLAENKSHEIAEINELIQYDKSPKRNEFIQYDKEPAINEMNDFMSLVKYPEAAKKANIEGKIVVGVLIDKEGKPVKTRIAESAHETLNDAAAQAAMEYDGYKPAIQNGKPAACWIMIPINFRLRK